MRQEDLVDAADAAAPQERGDLPAGHVRAADGPGVVEQRPPVGRLQARAAAVAHGQEGDAQLVLPRRGGANQAEAQPRQPRGEAEHRTPPQRLVRQPQRQAAVENPQPPTRHVADVDVAPGRAVGPIDHTVAQEQRPVDRQGRPPGNGTAQRRQRKQGKAEQHGEGRQRAQGRQEHQAGG